MHQLLLLRHAKSSWDDPDMPDEARPLNARGRHAAAAMRTAMGTLDLAPDLVLVSPARRTRETLDALLPWTGATTVEQADALYLATAAQLLALVRTTPAHVRSLLVIGHNPGLHDFALMLVGESAVATDGKLDTRRLAEGFPAGALAELALPQPWPALDGGAGRLVRFLSPRDLADPGE